MKISIKLCNSDNLPTNARFFLFSIQAVDNMTLRNSKPPFCVSKINKLLVQVFIILNKNGP